MAYNKIYATNSYGFANSLKSRDMKTEPIETLKENIMHIFKLGDKVYHKADSVPFEVVGIRKTTVEIQGDWSGGTHNVCQKGWVKHTDIEPYDQTKVRYYINGKSFMNGVALT